jgi:hypothetical protein
MRIVESNIAYLAKQKMSSEFEAILIGANRLKLDCISFGIHSRMGVFQHRVLDGYVVFLKYEYIFVISNCSTALANLFKPSGRDLKFDV